MIALVQWSLLTPADWVSIDLRSTGTAARAWSNLATKPVPGDASAIDNVPGWVFSVNVHGVDLYGFDHVALEPMATNNIRAYCWTDDTADPSFTYRWGEVWEFRSGSVDRTLPVAGGTIRHRGPDQRKTIYAEDVTDMARFAPGECGGMAVQVLPWAQFPVPAASITRHGIWVKDSALWQRHFDVRRKPSWREWVA